MKKKTMLSIIAISMSIGLASCGMFDIPTTSDKTNSSSSEESLVSSTASSSSVHKKHSYGEWVLTQQPTCTEWGAEERQCIECGETQTKEIAPSGHEWKETGEMLKEPTCESYGEKIMECRICFEHESVKAEPLGHNLIVNDVVPALCEQSGRIFYNCSREGCEHTEVQYTPPLGHNWVRDNTKDNIPATCEEGGIENQMCTNDGCAAERQVSVNCLGHCYQSYYGYGGDDQIKTVVNYCINGNCDDTYMSFKATKVTSASKEHLVFNDDGGVRFWGRPIGNAVELDESGSASRDNHEAIFDKTEGGDYFEFVFELTDQQVSKLKDCKLYCDAKPASYMGSNNLDFWKFRGDASSEWTYGMYIDDAPEHVNEDGTGKIIEDFRYVLYVDDELKEMDYSIDTPVPQGDPRGEYAIPYTFNLHAGMNKIRLAMSSGYKSTFYNFTFRPCEPAVSLTEASIFEEEGNAWLRVGGNSNAKAEDVAKWSPYLNFQNVKNWSSTRVEGDKIRYNTSVAGKVYLEANITGVFASGNSYNTHLNITENKQQDCKMKTFINQTYRVGALQIQVFSDPTQSAAGDEGFWGNLGFRVTDNPDFVPEFNPVADVTALNGSGKTVKQYRSIDGSTQRIGIDVDDYSSTSEGAIKIKSSTGIKLNRGGSLTYEVYIDGAPSDGQKVKLSIGDTPGSYQHVTRHIWNDALPIPEGAPEDTSEGFMSGGSSDDKDTEDPWRIGVKVGGEDVAITNYKTLQECGLSMGQLGYVDLCEITLKNGNNTIEISQKNIGYSFVFGGELRMEWKGASTLIATPPCEHEFVEDVCSKCNVKQYKVAVANPKTAGFIGSNGKQVQNGSVTFSVIVDSAGEYEMYLPCKISLTGVDQTLSVRQLQIKVGDAEAINPTNNSKTAGQLGLNDTDFNEALISKVTLAEGENTITISNGSSVGYRLTFDNANFYVRFVG